jgi:hypothetical protein
VNNNTELEDFQTVVNALSKYFLSAAENIFSMDGNNNDSMQCAKKQY